MYVIVYVTDVLIYYHYTIFTWSKSFIMISMNMYVKNYRDNHDYIIGTANGGDKENLIKSYEQCLNIDLKTDKN